MRKIQWGVLSTAKIGVEKVIPALGKSNLCEVRAIASRDAARARAAGRKLGIPRTYGSYQRLLADPEVEAVYNPLPNHLHVPLSIQALKAGKHVLCEKPIALSVNEAQLLLETAAQFPGLKIMEAFMYRFHPQWTTAKRLVDQGQIGRLLTIQSFFSYHNIDPANIRNNPDWGGGGLMDIGCYPISLARFIFGREPRRVMGFLEYDSEFRVDRLASGVLDFEVGTATFSCGTQMTPYQRVHIFGSRGRIEIEIPFNAPPDRPCRMWHQTDHAVEEIQLGVCDQYALQGDAFARAVLENQPVPTPLEDAVANMKVIEAVVASDQSDSWVEIPEV